MANEVLAQEDLEDPNGNNSGNSIKPKEISLPLPKIVVSENFDDFKAALEVATVKLNDQRAKYLLEFQKENFEISAFYDQHLRASCPSDTLVPHYANLYKFNEFGAEYISSEQKFGEGAKNSILENFNEETNLKKLFQISDYPNFLHF